MLHYHIVKICCNIYLLIALNGSKRKKKTPTNQPTKQPKQEQWVYKSTVCLFPCKLLLLQGNLIYEALIPCLLQTLAYCLI